MKKERFHFLHFDRSRPFCMQKGYLSMVDNGNLTFCSRVYIHVQPILSTASRSKEGGLLNSPSSVRPSVR